jgi:membrane protein DedA with SNARE-associated domain
LFQQGTRGVIHLINFGLLSSLMRLPVRTLAKSSLILVALTKFTYIALIAILMIAGAGVPIPEDIPLIFSGYLCNKQESPIRDLTVMIDTNHDGIKDTEVHRHVPNLWFMMLCGMVGVLAGDSLVFNIGRHGIESNNLVARHLRKVMHSRRREKVERHFAKHGYLTVFFGRFIPGFRSIIFAFAGLSKMSYFRFLLIDGIAAAISVPLFIYVGWHFADRINVVWKWADSIKHWALPVALLALAVALTIYFARRRKPVPAA